MRRIRNECVAVVLSLAGALLAVACAGGPRPEDSASRTRQVRLHWEENGFRRVTVRGREGVVVPSEAWAGPDQEWWTPSLEVLLQFESHLPTYLESVCPALVKAEPSYRRQYMGMGPNRSKGIVAVFFMCRDHDNWEHRAIQIHGGGHCYFYVAYDPESRRYYEFKLGGRAPRNFCEEQGVTTGIAEEADPDSPQAPDD